MRDRAGEMDGALRFGYVFHLKTLGLQPGLHLRDIGIVHAKMGAKFFRRYPLVIVRGACILLLVEDAAKLMLLVLV